MKNINWLKLLKNLLLLIAGSIGGTAATVSYLSYQVEQEQSAQVVQVADTTKEVSTRALPGQSRYFVTVRWRYSNRAFPGVDRFVEQTSVVSSERPTEAWLKENLPPPLPGYTLEKVISISGGLSIPVKIPEDN